jgi:hypothetical protein
VGRIKEMKKIFYKKEGRKYIPVSEYDSELYSAFTEGTHLVSVKPGVTSYMYKIDPAFAPMIAAGSYATDTIARAIVRASDLRPQHVVVTEEQRKAWHLLSETFGEKIHALEWPSAREAAEAAVDALTEEANKMLEVPAVRKAYEHFMFVYKLTKDEMNESKS